METMIETPLSRLSEEQIEAVGKEFDAIHDRILFGGKPVCSYAAAERSSTFP